MGASLPEQTLVLKLECASESFTGLGLLTPPLELLIQGV